MRPERSWRVEIRHRFVANLELECKAREQVGEHADPIVLDTFLGDYRMPKADGKTLAS